MMKCCHFVKKRNNRGSGLLGPVRRNGSVVGGEDPPHWLRCSPDFSLPAQSPPRSLPNQDLLTIRRRRLNIRILMSSYTTVSKISGLVFCFKSKAINHAFKFNLYEHLSITSGAKRDKKPLFKACLANTDVHRLFDASHISATGDMHGQYHDLLRISEYPEKIFLLRGNHEEAKSTVYVDSMTNITELPRPTGIPYNDLMCDLFRSDPDPRAMG
ncbi:serine/threonine-protein phosphatase PP1 [Striga asiatica]|uniref:Serine/threonine-protein phosphatase PP1 n=1 Tax=Striga asiatica TaxID=4170 RepID=A0A5A7QJU0_STRAF|nr:serine/threonine-protein phosphatase PP1 [Striga asiatica]